MSTSWNLVVPHVEGIAARQAHADIPADTFERELGRSGFAGAATHMYHRNPPTAWTDISGPICPRAFDPGQVVKPTLSPWKAIKLFHAPSIEVRYWRLDRNMEGLMRNADGDDLLFIHEGAGDFYCDYGHFAVEKSEYVVIPRGTMWRLDVSAPIDALLIEATGDHYRLPDRGMLGRHAPFDPGVLGIPKIDEAFQAQQGKGEWTVTVKRGGKFGSVTYPYNPLDALGWKGDLYPVRLAMRDVRAITSHRLHLPPSVRTSFETSRFIICTMAPRPVETDPGAMKLPFFHNNEDCDELIFYHSGMFGSRGNAVNSGMFTLNPMGFTHGPHPQTLPNMFKHPATMFDNYAIAIDTADQLQVPELPDGCEVAEFRRSWAKARDFAPDITAEPVKVK